jgi:ribonuclease Y
MWWQYLLVALVAGGASYAVAVVLHRAQRRREIAARRLESERIVDEARRGADEIRRKAELDAREQQLRAQAEFENKTRATREELQRLEERLLRREDNLEKKNELLAAREAELTRKEKEIQRRDQASTDRQREADRIVAEQKKKLEQVAGLSAEEARRQVVEKIVDEARRSAAKEVKAAEDGAKEEAEQRARRIIGIAIQRYAGEHVSERAVTTVHLPNDEMKGRIIGREGRNIRSFETATGVDVIIDDTPGAVVLSGFDPIRREVARVSLERLIADGRIHPGRIEELVAKVQKELEERIVEIGEQTVLEMGIVGLHEDLAKLLGRLHFRTSYGQNVLQHAKEVGWLCGLMASELRLDPQIAKRSGLLHDIGKALTHETEGIHSLIGGDVAERCGEPPQVVNAIRGHHDDVEATSLYAPLVQAADAISGARPGARGETLETYVRRLEKLETLATSFKGVDKCYAIQAGREIRIMVESEKVSDEEATSLSTSIARKVEKELEYPGQIKVVVIRETRSVEYAR